MYNRNFDIFEYNYVHNMEFNHELKTTTSAVIPEKQFKNIKVLRFKYIDNSKVSLLFGNPESNYHFFSTYEKAAQFKIDCLNDIKKKIREKLDDIIDKTLSKIEKIQPEMDEIQEKIKG